MMNVTKSEIELGCVNEGAIVEEHELIAPEEFNSSMLYATEEEK